ncbi:S-adenosyl-L-methionine-dependent methyltransferase [Sordaria brevicollis]|uniref:S-adenosyl-L-methionine-dependent methyltransferase n=1 Tax=Sordaria brevicollis TaxID=83679 RepID=A0AAE0PNZ8_SORBR|nr:S-adenosyl-L-methionine-dependent methyltransferase [Sordaria brevicollis]
MATNPEATSYSSKSINDHALQGQFQRLRSLFKDSDYSTHPEHWDTLWKESFTPWDRGGPSQALDEVLSSHRELFPKAPSSLDDFDKPRPKALVAGCGRGHDALLLAAHGYDVFGLDSSPTSLEEAKNNEKKVEGEENKELYAPRRELGVTTKGRVMWVVGDFFENDWVNDSGYGKVKNGFDLIFDYEFFCALPPEARPQYAKRMSDLLNPDGGRLVCLEWPLDKDPSTGGPPWGVSGDLYLAHLGHPGQELPYDDKGRVVMGGSADTTSTPGALKRLARIQPACSHKAGCDDQGNVIDRVSVWGHQ